MDSEWLMLTITGLLPQDAIIVDEALTTAASLPAYMHVRDRHAYFGNVSGGIGWGIAAAVGIQLAQPKRKNVGSSPSLGTAAPCIRSRRYGPPLTRNYR